MPKVNRYQLFRSRVRSQSSMQSELRLSGFSCGAVGRLVTPSFERKLRALDTLKTSLLHHAFAGNL